METIEDADPNKGLPGVKGLLITIGVIAAIFAAITGVENLKEGNRLQELRDHGQEVVAIVADKKLDSRVNQRAFNINTDLAYVFDLKGETYIIEVTEGVSSYGTQNVGDKRTLCVDPQNVENVEAEFPDCSNKLD